MLRAEALDEPLHLAAVALDVVGVLERERDDREPLRGPYFASSSRRNGRLVDAVRAPRPHERDEHRLARRTARPPSTTIRPSTSGNDDDVRAAGSFGLTMSKEPGRNVRRGGRVEPLPAPGDRRIRARAVLARERAVRQQLGVETVDVHAVEDRSGRAVPRRTCRGARRSRRSSRETSPSRRCPSAGRRRSASRCSSRRPSRRPSSRRGKRRPSGAGTGGAFRDARNGTSARPVAMTRVYRPSSPPTLRLGHDLRVVVRELERQLRAVPGGRRERDLGRAVQERCGKAGALRDDLQVEEDFVSGRGNQLGVPEADGGRRGLSGDARLRAAQQRSFLERNREKARGDGELRTRA